MKDQQNSDNNENDDNFINNEPINNKTDGVQPTNDKNDNVESFNENDNNKNNNGDNTKSFNGNDEINENDNNKNNNGDNTKSFNGNGEINKNDNDKVNDDDKSLKENDNDDNAKSFNENDNHENDNGDNANSGDKNENDDNKVNDNGENNNKVKENTNNKLLLELDENNDKVNDNKENNNGENCDNINDNSENDNKENDNIDNNDNDTNNNDNKEKDDNNDKVNDNKVNNNSENDNKVNNNIDNNDKDNDTNNSDNKENDNIDNNDKENDTNNSDNKENDSDINNIDNDDKNNDNSDDSNKEIDKDNDINNTDNDNSGENDTNNKLLLDKDKNLCTELIIYPHNKLGNLSNEQIIILWDLNYHFKRIDKIIECISGLNREIDNKKLEANEALDYIETNMSLLTDEEPMCFIEEDIETLDDLLYVAKKYGCKKYKKNFCVDVTILHKIIKPLEKLKNIIGMTKIKDQVVDQILTSLQDLYDDGLMFHTIIRGPPGVGKTLLAKVLGEIYVNMGILKNDGNKLKFEIAKRSDLIGKYLGHTSVKTQNMIDKCDGGVLFIDEVYSLGNEEKKDSFSKECIDTLNINLTEKKNFICVIAGYPEEIDKCFFSYNPGLKRRFPFGYDIDGYTSVELKKIFMSKIITSNWSFDSSITDKLTCLETFIDERKDNFENFGGDIDSLILNTKIVHGRRIFGKDPKLRKKLIMEDIIAGYERMLKNKNKKENIFEFSHMYT
jgi:hypothetical protein